MLQQNNPTGNRERAVLGSNSRVYFTHSKRNQHITGEYSYMALFVRKACSTSHKKDTEILSEWRCPVHCHCRMPDDGNEMVLCIDCKRWFHGKCEMGNFYSPQWRCKPCQDVFEKEQKKETERKKREDKVQQLRRVAANYPVESTRVQELYTAIAGMYQDFPSNVEINEVTVLTATC